MKLSLVSAMSLAMLAANAQGPEITSWIINPGGQTGYAGIPSNVQQVQYSASNVYVSAASIPGYSIGPWNGNPNVPANQHFVFKITRSPQQNTGTPAAIGLGHTGVWINGVSIFNVSDAQSYNNAGVWNRNAYFWEGPGFDNCLGHPQQQGEYHHHVSPSCLYNVKDSLHHSPLIGFAFDGFPVYGAYGYASATTPGAIRRMRSSYQATTTSTRANGPNVSSTYPAGCFIEDYQFVQSTGDLDARNGRYCVTPEYPNGTFAYFATLDGTLAPAFPYTMFGSYYGIVQAGNTGPGSGHQSISESVTTYTPAASGIYDRSTVIDVALIPDETHGRLQLYISPVASNDFVAVVTDLSGRTVLVQEKIQPAVLYTLDLQHCIPGIYAVRISNGVKSFSAKLPVGEITR